MTSLRPRVELEQAGRAPQPVVSMPVVLLGLIYLALVGYFTLARVPWSTVTNEAPWGVLSPSAWVDPLTWSSGSPFEFVANIIMFVPIGLLARFAFRRASTTVILCIGAVITSSIEVAQIPLERVSDPRDLVANGIGAVLGTVLGALVLLVRRPSR